MRCFYHPTVEAVGLCRTCSRGVCPACAAETAGGLACRDRHEEEVERTSQIVRRNLAVSGRIGPPQIGLMIVAAIGAVVMGWAAYGGFREGDVRGGAMLAVMAGFFGLFSLAFVRALILRPKAMK